MTRKPFDPSLIRPPAVPTERSVFAAPGKQPAMVSVAQVTALVKRAIESSLPTTLCVVGEVSNFKRHSSGHLYFTLKDKLSELSCVMWRSAAAKLKFTPTAGMEVLATGHVEVFERAGRYQLYVRKIEPRGVGALDLAFRQLCEKLSQEGLFDPKHKKNLPRFPRRIALVTSPTGAAITDMIRTLQRRYPCVDVLVYPTRVQGEKAAGEIAYGIQKLNANAAPLGGIDLIIVGRGGGSLEDLWAFNEEIVARAIYASRLPVISAVGHEVDVTVADLVADVRAATPTAAAELAVPMLDEVLERLAGVAGSIQRALDHKLAIDNGRLAVLLNRPFLRDPSVMYRSRTQSVDQMGMDMDRELTARLRQGQQKLDQLERIVRRIAPLEFLFARTVDLMRIAIRLRRATEHRVSQAQHSLMQRRTKLERSSPIVLLARRKAQLDRLGQLMASLINHQGVLLSNRVERQAKVLEALGYKSILRRGFSIARTKRGRRLIRSRSDVYDNDRIVTETSDGEFESQVINRQQLELFD